MRTEKLISQQGEVILITDWLAKEQLDKWFTILLDELEWQQETLVLYGKQVKCPRLTAWYGDENIRYRYSGIDHIACGWHPVLVQIKAEIEKLSKLRLNSVLCNLYRDGKDAVGWHADNEPALGKNPSIASFSLGATRKFNLKHKTKGIRKSVELNHGSLLLMLGETQNHWLHSLPKTPKLVGPRINLTFRNIRGRPQYLNKRGDTLNLSAY